MTSPAAVDRRARRRGPTRPAAWVVAGVVYLGLGVLVWWHLWWGGVGHALASGLAPEGRWRGHRGSSPASDAVPQGAISRIRRSAAATG